MLQHQIWGWFLAICVLFSPVNVFAEIVYTTMPGPTSPGGLCFSEGNAQGGGLHIAAAGIHVPAGSGYALDAITVRLQDNSGGPDTPFEFTLYEDAEGIPGDQVATIGSGTGTSSGTQTYDLYYITPVSVITLQSNTNYWIVATSSSNIDCAFGWMNRGTDPAGSIFAYVDEQQFYDNTWHDSGGSYLQLEIDATPIDTTPQISIEEGYIKLDTTGGGSPPAADCTENAHEGRMVFDETVNSLYICGQGGWVSFTLNDL